MRSASRSIARSAPFRLGTSTDASRPGKRLGEGQHLGRVGQLRQQARRHEGADFDLALAGGVGGANPFELGGRRDDPGDALQAVAQAHLADHGAPWRGKWISVSPDLQIGLQSWLQV